MKKIYIIIIFFTVSFSTKSLNFAVSPTKFNADLSKNSIFEVYLLNNTSKPLRLEIYTEIPKGYENQNLEENIVIYPKIVSIKPAGKKNIHFKVKKMENREDKEFKSLLIFKESLPNIKEVRESKKFDMQLDFITEIAVGVYGK